MAHSGSQQSGAALVSVLLVLGVVSALMATSLSHIQMATRLVGNADALVAARYQAQAAEALAQLELRRIIDQSAGVLTNDAGWKGKPIPVPLNNGLMTLTLEDESTCFNLNSVVSAAEAEGDGSFDPRAVLYTPRRAGQRQLLALLIALDIGQSEAERFVATLTDWIDSDARPVGLGAEDRTYTNRAEPYRAGNQPLRHISELRALEGMTPEIYDRAAQHLCALPHTRLAEINVNLLDPEDAPLLVALFEGQLTLSAAEQIISSRPPGGWRQRLDFWNTPALRRLEERTSALNQTVLTSTHFRLNVDVTMGDMNVTQTAWMAVEDNIIMIVQRSWAPQG